MHMMFVIESPFPEPSHSRRSTVSLRVAATAVFVLLSTFGAPSADAQHSVARQWNEVTLEAIRDDLARPTIHARNLFHTAVAMYDAWAAYDPEAEPYLLGRAVDAYSCPFEGIPNPQDVDAARREAISHAAYRLLVQRFRNSPGAAESLALMDSLMAALGYDPAFTSTDYAGGSAAALGNRIAECVIEFGLQDGANEDYGYANEYYAPANPALNPNEHGNSSLEDPNRWQPLAFDLFIDQSGNVVPGGTPKFVSPEWGSVVPFAMDEDQRTTYQRDGHPFRVYYDPGPPPFIDTTAAGGTSEDYKWGFSLVSAWSSHLDPSDGVMWDISPASIGNIPEFPQGDQAYRDFYNLREGGDMWSQRRAINPRTGRAYEEQWVPRGDYTRVLAEFWADGPDSETPPGHWYTILNKVSDHPLLEKRVGGQGDKVDDLEWDVKSYFALGGAVHDAAIAAWGIKGWYDYIRPISAIRWMAARGQSSDASRPGYDPVGILLEEGLIELVEAGDPLAGTSGEHVGKIKVRAWRGPSAIADPETDAAGVGWILAENWWPYQRPTFVTPPFAGFVSGHSTYSRAAAVVLTKLTGDEYFPGGIGEFIAPKNEFLVFEEGPSVDVTLQWATYRDASDQCSLSRIWGGIHPPADDIPGRAIGEHVGAEAFTLASRYFTGDITTSIDGPVFGASEFPSEVYPNPVDRGNRLTIEPPSPSSPVVVHLYNVMGQLVFTEGPVTASHVTIATEDLSAGVYVLRISSRSGSTGHLVVVR